MTQDTFLRGTTWVVLVTFSSMITQPVQAALRLPDPAKAARQRTSQPTAPESIAVKQSRLLAEIHNILKELEPEAAYPVTAAAPKKGEEALEPRAIGPGMRIKTERAQPLRSTVDRAAKLKALKAKQAQLAQLAAAADADFDAVRQHLLDKKLPAELLLRHDEAVKDYQQRRAEYDQLMQAVLDADANKTDTAAPLRALAAFMAKYPNQKTHPPTDPNKLPFGTPSGKVRAPIETEQGFKTSLFSPRKLHGWQPYTVAAAGSLSGISLPSTTVSATPTAADLAETEDIQLTPAIRAQAAALNNNPVQIHNWVRNNIEFIPSYGSIQGAGMTLQTKLGNSFDTASLEIALLRAAGIPARYVYGTIQVPADQAMNWVGGVTKPEAALQLMGQGGIPSIGLVSGGSIKYIKLEHVWVEAFVDYVPSRGAVNRTADTWIPMDASFKQYTYTQGMDLKTAVPLDAQALITQAQTGATVDPSGWVQNINGAAIQSALTTYQTQVQTYINAQKTNATVADVIGSKTIITQNYSILMGTLPYTTITTGGKFTELPTLVRHQFQYNLYASALDRALDNPVFSFQQSLPNIAGKKITLSFAPATAADTNLIASYLPAPHADGTPILPSELPTSLPGYLIHLTAELRLDGQVFAQGGTFSMGDELVASEGLFDPARGWDMADDTRPTAGEYIATHVDLQGVSTAQLNTLKDRMTANQSKLSAAQYAGITKEDISGDILYSAVLSYFATNQTSSQITSRAMGIVEYRKPSFGNFAMSVKPIYWFGIPRNTSFPGLVMDIVRYASINVAKNNDPATAIAYNKQNGMKLSAYEHVIPETLFTDPQDPNRPQAVSAVKALALAASQGQKIYTLNAQNLSQQQTLLTQIIIDPQAMADIQNALAAGKEVVVHQAPITQSGWAGSGYIITDPATGTGAYKIGGGANGGNLTGIAHAAAALGIITLLIGKLIAAEILAPLVLLTAPMYFAIFAVIVFTALIIEIITSGGLDPTCGGQPTCQQTDTITGLASGGVAATLLEAGASGNLLALVLGALLAMNIFKGH